MLLLQVLITLLLITYDFAQDVPWEHTCVSDPSCIPTFHVENHAEEIMYFALECDNYTPVLEVDPGTTQSFPAVFPSEGENPDTEDCVLKVAMDTYGIPIYTWFNDSSAPLWNNVYCSTSPGLDTRFVASTTCELDAEGFLTLEFTNNLELEDQYMTLVCYNDYGNYDNYYEMEADYVIPPKTTQQVKAVFLDHYFGDYEDAECVMMKTGDGYERMIYHTMDHYYYNYFSGALYCMGRTASDLPIVHVIPHCPPTASGIPTLELRADVPAYGLARCRNGDQAFVSVDEVTYSITGTFYQGATKDCQFYRKFNSNTYTIDVEVGWGEEDREVFLYQKVHTLSCSYDAHGDAGTSVELIADWFIAPNEEQRLFGGASAGTFDLRVLDVLNRQVTTGHISIGKKIRLKASDSTGTLPAFRALSCLASNGVTTYPILRAGCGDGIVLGKTEGFITAGNVVYSPYFNAFKLRGGRAVWFHCRFTVCGLGECDGSSCNTVDEIPIMKRSVPDVDLGVFDRRTLNFELLD